MWKASIILRRGRCRVRATKVTDINTRQRRLYNARRSNKLIPASSTVAGDDNSNIAMIAAALLSAGAVYTISQQDKVECDNAVPIHHRTNPFSISTSTSLSRRRTSQSQTMQSTPIKQDQQDSNKQQQKNIPKRYPTRHNPHQPRNVMLHRMRSVRARGMNEKYKVEWGTVLGEGAYGSVHPARLRATGQKVALKKISKRYTNSSSFRTETDALLRIYDNGGHPNISGLRDMYEDATHFYMILDLVSGGEMFDHLIHYGAYSEADAARLMHEVSSALAFLHGVGVVHADLKPENLLLCSKKRHDGTIKMIDFGCAVVSEPENYIKDDDDFFDDDDDGYENESNSSKKRMSSIAATLATTPVDESTKSASSTGTTAYWPPERFKQTATADAGMDMWSVGVILYIMLTGLHPFDVKCNSTDKEIEEHIQANPYPPLSPEFTSHLSDSAVDLIQKLMEVNPTKRITAYEMLHHPWVLGETATKEKILDSDKKLSHFVDIRNKLEAGIFAVLVSHGHQDVSLSEAKKPMKQRFSEKGGSDESTQIMKRAFDFFDSEGKGYLTSDDLAVVVRNRTGSDISTTDAQEFIAKEHGRESKAAKLSFSDFSGLFSGLKHKHFPRGHIIFRAGDDGDAMYFLNSGKVEIQTRKGQLVSILRSGDFFGEGSLLREDKKRFTTAKCSTPVDVIKIRKDDFEKYVASSKETKNELQLKWRARNLSYAKNLIRLQTNVKTRVLKKGEVVYKEGDVGTSMFRVCDDDDGGELEVSHGGSVVHKYAEGESFGESSLLFARPRSSTVTCISDSCKIHEMRGEDFMELVSSSPEMAATLRDMCRKRLFKKAVKAFSLEKKRGYSDEDIVDVFHEADRDKSGYLDFEELKHLMHRMDPSFPISEIELLLKFIDVDEDGLISLAEFKRLFRQFEAD